MNESGGKSNKLPEWSIFERLDELETITLELMDKKDKTEPKVTRELTQSKDAFLLAQLAYVVTFTTFAQAADKNKLVGVKDSILKFATNVGMSEETRKWLDTTMLNTIECHKE